MNVPELVFRNCERYKISVSSAFSKLLLEEISMYPSKAALCYGHVIDRLFSFDKNSNAQAASSILP